jgi:hypothetical protein
MRRKKGILGLGTMIVLLATAACLSGCALGEQGELSSAIDLEEATDASEMTKSLPPMNPDDVMRYGREVYLTQETRDDGGESSAEADNGDGIKNGDESESRDGSESGDETKSSEQTESGEETKGSNETGSGNESESRDATKSDDETKNSNKLESDVGKDGGETVGDPMTESNVAPKGQDGAYEKSVQDSENVGKTETNVVTNEDPCAGGHVYGGLYVWREATCTVPADLCQVCVTCGAEKHVSGGLAEHVLVKTLVKEGNCIEPYEYRYDCVNCDYFSYEQDYSQMENGHQYSTGSYQEFDENLLEWVIVTVTKCGICGKELERTRSE